MDRFPAFRFNGCSRPQHSGLQTRMAQVYRLDDSWPAAYRVYRGMRRTRLN